MNQIRSALGLIKIIRLGTTISGGPLRLLRIVLRALFASGPDSLLEGYKYLNRRQNNSHSLNQSSIFVRDFDWLNTHITRASEIDSTINLIPFAKRRDLPVIFHKADDLSEMFKQAISQIPKVELKKLVFIESFLNATISKNKILISDESFDINHDTLFLLNKATLEETNAILRRGGYAVKIGEESDSQSTILACCLHLGLVIGAPEVHVKEDSQTHAIFLSYSKLLSQTSNLKVY